MRGRNPEDTMNDRPDASRKISPPPSEKRPEKCPAKAKRAQNVISRDQKSRNVGSLFWRTFSGGDGFLLLMGVGRLYCTFTASVEFFLPSPGSVLLGAFQNVGEKFSR